MTVELGQEAGGRQERRRERTRERLVASARRLISDRGADAVTIAEIAEAADLGFGTFYNYFESKDAILDAVTVDAIATHGHVLEQISGGFDDIAAAVAGGIRLTVRMVDSDPVWAEFVVRVSLTDGRLWRPLAERLNTAIAAGCQSGRFNVRDVAAARWAIGGAIIATMRARLWGELGADADQHVAAAALRMLGLPAGEADRIALAPLPDAATEAEQPMTHAGTLE